MTCAYGLIGWPLTTSRSPALHRAAFAALAIDATYELFPVAPGTLGEAMRDFRARGIAGLNVTVPHKVDALAHLDALDPLAREVGAVNTIVRGADGALVGWNTDVMGLVRALEEAGLTLAGRTAIVIGAGGAARATLAALALQAPREVYVVARDRARARSVAARHGATPLRLGDPSLSEAFAEASVIIHATPATWDAAGGAALVASLPLARLPTDAVVVDLAYGAENPLLAAARTRGLRGIDGRGMLLHQAALAFELWTGEPAPLTAMRAVLAASQPANASVAIGSEAEKKRE